MIDQTPLSTRSSRALDSLFSTLKTHGATFRPDFWDSVCQEVLFPIFAPLRSGHMQEEELWISTTMVTALRNLVDMYTFYFETLARLLDPLLELLCFCIDQGALFVSAVPISRLALTPIVSLLSRK